MSEFRDQVPSLILGGSGPLGNTIAVSPGPGMSYLIDGVCFNLTAWDNPSGEQVAFLKVLIDNIVVSSQVFNYFPNYQAWFSFNGLPVPPDIFLNARWDTGGGTEDDSYAADIMVWGRVVPYAAHLGLVVPPVE